MSASAPSVYRPGAVLIPPITVSQVADFKAGVRNPSTTTTTTSSNSSSSPGAHASFASSILPGPLPRFVLADGSSYYGDVHPSTQLPDGLGVVLFKTDASGMGAAFDGAAPSGMAGYSSREFAKLVKARNQFLAEFTAAFSAGDRYGGFWRGGLCDGEGVLLTSTFTFQGQFSQGKPHGRGHMCYHRNFVDRMPSSGTGGALEGGIGSLLFKGITSVLLAPIPEALVGSSGGPNKPKEYMGDYDRTFLRHGTGMMKYANGDSYEGEWQHNRRTGQGKFVSEETGEQYEGAWFADERHGYGSVKYADGSFFKGLFDRGVRSGEGLWLFPNGDEYYGNFEKNKIQGEGTMKFKNGDVYIGSWRDGTRHGEGKYILKRKGITVKGTFVKGLMEGRGRVEYPHTGVFVGQFERGERRSGTMYWCTEDEIATLGEGERQGQRTATTSVGLTEGRASPAREDPRRCYQGEWMGEHMHGKGLMWWRNGDFFCGRFAKNMREGPGNLRYGSGGPASGDTATTTGDGASTTTTTTTTTTPTPAREYSGFFRADRRHGFGIEQSPDGSIKAGRWDNDVFVEGYEGEWDNANFHGVGRLRLSLAAFFRTLGDKVSTDQLAAIQAASTTAMSLAPPPLGMPSLLSFLSSGSGCSAAAVSSTSTGGGGGAGSDGNPPSTNSPSPAGGNEHILSVHTHPERLESYNHARACWQTAVTAALELNELFMVEFFGIFRNGRRDGSGILRLPFSCERLPGVPPAHAAAAKPRGGYGRRLLRRVRLGGGAASTSATTSTGHGYEDLLAARARQQRQPPTLLLRRHVLKGQWENNIFDCDRGVWSFPGGETYVGGFRCGAREHRQPEMNHPSSPHPQSSRDEPGGLLYFPDGSVFSGSWRRDAPSGSGCLLCKDRQSPVYERRLDVVASRDGAAPAGAEGTCVSSSGSASTRWRRRELRRSLTRRTCADDREEQGGSSDGQPAPAASTGPGFLGLNYIVNLFTSAAANESGTEESSAGSTDGDSNYDGVESSRQVDGGGAREVMTRVLTGYEDAYYLFGSWYQETDSGVPPARYGDPAAGAVAAMPYTEYERRVMPKTLPPLPTDQRALTFSNTTMADTAIGLRPPPPELGQHLTTTYGALAREGGGDGGELRLGAGGGSSGAGSRADGAGGGSGEASQEEYYTRLLLGVGGVKGDRRPSDMALPTAPAALNIARASGEGVYLFPATGVCVQAFFLDGMPRLAVPYRAGSALDTYLASAHAQEDPMLPSRAGRPSACSDYAYLLNGLECLRESEVFSAGPSIVRGSGGGEVSSAGAGALEERESEYSHDSDGARDHSHDHSVGGATTTTAAVYPAARAPARTLGERPEPLPSCTMCGKAYSFFRAAGCCTLCFRSCCSSCLHNLELLQKAAASSSSAAGGGGLYGYNEVSALLASSHYLLQKLKKGPDAFTPEAAAGAATTTMAATTEVTSRQLLTLLSGSAALPVCGDCIRTVLMRVERQIQWIPLRLFSSILALEEEDDQREGRRARAARGHHHNHSSHRSSHRHSARRPRTAGEDRVSTHMARARSGEALGSEPGRCLVSEEPLGSRGAVTHIDGETFSTGEETSPIVSASVEAHGRAGTPESCHPSLSAAPSPLPRQPPLEQARSRSSSTSENASGGADSSDKNMVSDGRGGAAIETEEGASEEGFAVYRGYTSHGVPHLCGELWWWPSSQARAATMGSREEAEGLEHGAAMLDARSRTGGGLHRVLHLGSSAGVSRRRGRRRGKGRDAAAADDGPTVLLTVMDRGSQALAAANVSPTHRRRGEAGLGSGLPRVKGQPRRQLRYHYVGSFSAGKRCGHGVLTFENGERYIGRFAKDQMNGEGFYFCDDGAVVHGEWRKNRLVEVYYIGELDEATRSPRGLGICFLAAVRRARPLHGDARTHTATDEDTVRSGGPEAAAPPRPPSPPPDAQLYNGEWHRGRMHGRGTLHLCGGVTYRGHLCHDTMEGVGWLSSPSSEFYGTFARNVRHGYGIEFFYDVDRGPRVSHPRGQQHSPAGERARDLAAGAVSSVVEGQWSADVSDGFVRMCVRRQRLSDSSGASARAASSLSSSFSFPGRPRAGRGVDGGDGFEMIETTYRGGNERDDCFAAPLMRDDGERAECVLCHKSFQFFVRRHHCRLCGELVCDACSRRRARLPAHFFATEAAKARHQREAHAARNRVATAGEPGSDSTPRVMASFLSDTAGTATAAATGGASVGVGEEADVVPQRVCDVCFIRLEQRRQLVIRKYADNSVYCGCSCRGRWVSRGLYWRADGLFFIFDDAGKLVERPRTTGEVTAGGTVSDRASAPTVGLGASSSSNSYILSSSILQDAALTKEFLDSNPVVFSESSPTAELDRFLRWWLAMNTRCMLSLGPLDLPQLRAYMRLSARTRASAAAGVGVKTGREGATRVILAGSAEAHAMSVAALFPGLGLSPVPRPSPTDTAPVCDSGAPPASSAVTPSSPATGRRGGGGGGEGDPAVGSLDMDPVELGIDVDFQRWTQFPTPPVVTPVPRFLSYDDAVRLKRHPHGADAVNESGPEGLARDIDAALLRADRHRPALLTRPPLYPFGKHPYSSPPQPQQEQQQQQQQGRSDSQSETPEGGPGLPASGGGLGVGSGCGAMTFTPPPPLSAVDMDDEELLRAVAKERVEGFMPFLPPSQLDPEVHEETETGDRARQPLCRADAAPEMRLLACYDYANLFPPTPDPPALYTDDSVPWRHWQVREVPVFNPSRPPPVRRAQRERPPPPPDVREAPSATLSTQPAAHTDALASGEVLDERALLFGCPFNPVVVSNSSEVVENGKIRKVAELMVGRERAALRRHQRHQLRLQKRRARAEERARRAQPHGSATPSVDGGQESNTSSTSTTLSEETEGDGEGGGQPSGLPQGGGGGGEMVHGLTAMSLAVMAARTGGPAVADSVAEGSSRTAPGVLVTQRSRQRERHHEQISALLTMSRNDKAWLPEHFCGPFRFSLRCDNV